MPEIWNAVLAPRPGAQVLPSRCSLPKNLYHNRRGQHNRDEDARNEWRALPLRGRYDWLRMVITPAAVGAIVALVFRDYVTEIDLLTLNNAHDFYGVVDNVGGFVRFDFDGNYFHVFVPFVDRPIERKIAASCSGKEGLIGRPDANSNPPGTVDCGTIRKRQCRPRDSEQSFDAVSIT